MPVKIELTRNTLSTLNHITGSLDFSVGIPDTEPNRMLASMCIVRAVNLLTDLEQNGKFVKSVNSAATEMGLPGYLVDVRHDATHSELPGAFILSHGLRDLFGWLLLDYWNP